MSETEELAEVSERMALLLTDLSMQRMTARVMSAFVFTEEPALTSGELCERLHASAGAVSMAIKTLTTLDLLERVPVPGSRRDHYRLRDDPWAVMSSAEPAAFDALRKLADEGLERVEPDSDIAHRLANMRDFYAFVQQEIPKMMERWRDLKRDGGQPQGAS
ncbi:MAG TPA: MarR family transcriptional regulator [Streptosporangiaceae bacterium]|jgi:DNA-binding transcriptional regulator GbsR (MarR family)